MFIKTKHPLNNIKELPDESQLKPRSEFPYTYDVLWFNKSIEDNQLVFKYYIALIIT